MKLVKYLHLLLVCFLVACSGEPSKETLLAEINDIEYIGDDSSERSVFLSAKSKLSSTIILLKNGRYVDRKELNDALTIAVLFDAETVAKFLMDKGADVNVKGDKGRTALMYATRSGHLEMVKSLVEHGADVNAMTEYGETALTDAIERWHSAIAEFLVENGADVNAKNKYGITSLMVATRVGYLGIVQFLVENGADVNARASSGRTALYFAKQNASPNRQNIVDLLLAHGATE